MSPSFPIRTECPPGACICGREQLLARPGGDVRILRLTKEEEKRLVARIEGISSLSDLQAMQAKMHAQLGMVLTIVPSVHEVRTMRGFTIELAEQAGLCRKTRQAIPAAVRRCLERTPAIAYAILNGHDLLADV